MPFSARTSHLRVRKPDEASEVTFAELFFDLVFVFAVTQLSHHLVQHPTPMGLLQTTLMFLAVWWAWIDTSWVTNWVDPERTPVRVMLMVLMLVGLALSTSIPEAFEGRALIFALAYTALQMGRGLFVLWATHRHDAANFRNFLRIVGWQAASSALWIAGALTENGVRLMLWSAAVAIDCAGPAAGFWLPGLGGSTTQDWNVEGAHIAERVGLFIIIALGESILVTGATYADLDLGFGNTAAFLVAFTGSIVMWWLYFDSGAKRGSRRISSDENPGRLARLVYTYFHIPLVAGIIVAAVGDEMVLHHPHGHVGLAEIGALIGGPALYLFGNLLFKRSVIGRWPLSHMGGLGILALGAAMSAFLPLLGVAAWAAATLVIVAVWEAVARREGRTAT